mmetsp:Transcript_124799/g.399919  ORF Transcript_124799/g.399919 Transcript_124799/m.399919 type:complete len:273 (-) Transcript_124799:471-1289(-)
MADRAMSTRQQQDVLRPKITNLTIKLAGLLEAEDPVDLLSRRRVPDGQLTDDLRCAHCVFARSSSKSDEGHLAIHFEHRPVLHGPQILWGAALRADHDGERHHCLVAQAERGWVVEACYSADNLLTIACGQEQICGRTSVLAGRENVHIPVVDPRQQPGQRTALHLFHLQEGSGRFLWRTCPRQPTSAAAARAALGVRNTAASSVRGRLPLHQLVASPSRHAPEELYAARQRGIHGEPHATGLQRNALAQLYGLGMQVHRQSVSSHQSRGHP